jgi:dihydrofolate reductase
VPAADIRFVSGAVVPVLRQMQQAAAGKNVWIVGGGELAAQFHDARLLDELNVTYAPAILGAGAPLFPRRLTYPRLKLLEARSYGGVFVQARYSIDKSE